MQVSCTSLRLGNYASIMYITSAGKLCKYHVHHLSWETMQVSCMYITSAGKLCKYHVHHLSWETMQLSCTSPQLGNYATIMYITSAAGFIRSSVTSGVAVVDAGKFCVCYKGASSRRQFQILIILAGKRNAQPETWWSFSNIIWECYIVYNTLKYCALYIIQRFILWQWRKSSNSDFWKQLYIQTDFFLVNKTYQHLIMAIIRYSVLRPENNAGNLTATFAFLFSLYYFCHYLMTLYIQWMCKRFFLFTKKPGLLL